MHLFWGNYIHCLKFDIAKWPKCFQEVASSLADDLSMSTFQGVDGMCGAHFLVIRKTWRFGAWLIWNTNKSSLSLSLSRFIAFGGALLEFLSSLWYLDWKMVHHFLKEHSKGIPSDKALKVHFTTEIPHQLRVLLLGFWSHQSTNAATISFTDTLNRW